MDREKNPINYNLIEFDQFKQDFQFIFLKGLKGLQQACQIQEKQSSKLYDYFELDLKDVKKFDEYLNFCEDLMFLEHGHILKLYKYSRIFGCENLVSPYCKYFLIFEYCESNIQNEMIHLKQSHKFFKQKTMRKIFESVASALDFLHEKRMLHGDLRSEQIYKAENGEYKIVPPKINIRDNSVFYCYSPEEYQYNKFRSNLDRQDYDKFKAEIFSFGMLILSIANFQTYQQFYGKFSIHKEVTKQALLQFEIKYGYHMAFVLQKCLEVNPLFRIAAPDVVLLLNSEELKIEEKEKIQNQKLQSMQNRNQFISNIFSYEADATGNETGRSAYLLNTPSQYSPTYKTPGHKKKKLATSKFLSDIKSNNNNKQILKKSRVSIRIEQPNQRGDTISPLKSKKQIDIFADVQGNAFSQALKIINQSNVLQQTDEEEADKGEDVYSILPQEWQDRIDNKVTQNIKKVEDFCKTEYFQGGNRYQGEKKDGKPHGWGIWQWANGELYEGEFKEGKYDGYGIYYWPNSIKYYGEFVEGKIQGLGMRIYEIGIYFGEWKNGKNDGKGIFYWNSGEKFKGSFLNDKIYGKGVLYVNDDNDEEDERVYEGLWKDEEGTGIKVDKYDFESKAEKDSEDQERIKLGQYKKAKIEKKKPFVTSKILQNVKTVKK